VSSLHTFLRLFEPIAASLSQLGNERASLETLLPYLQFSSKKKKAVVEKWSAQANNGWLLIKAK